MNTLARLIFSFFAIAVAVGSTLASNTNPPPDVSAPPADSVKTSTGLASKVLALGSGNRKPSASDTVTVHYSGWTTNGKLFDSSWERNQPATFPLSNVIEGWKEGVPMMVEGEKRRFWIPAKLAYGTNPKPKQPKGMLVFDIELLSIKGRGGMSAPAVQSTPVSTTRAVTGIPATTSIQTDANQPRIEVLKDQAPNAIEWTLAPLEQAVPGDIRQNLTFLREDLLDEGKQQPKASADAYTLAAQICQTVLAALEERNQTLARAGFRAVEAQARTGVSSQALEARRNYKMSWPQFAREESQRAELKSQALAGANVMAERPKLEWSQRTAALRTQLDQLYAKFREALRQSPPAK